MPYVCCVDSSRALSIFQAPLLPLRADPSAKKTPSWPRSWANFSLLELYSHRNAWANLHLLGQPDAFLAHRQEFLGGLSACCSGTRAERLSLCFQLHDCPGPPGAFCLSLP
jgi:hypothetical protein